MVVLYRSIIMQHKGTRLSCKVLTSCGAAMTGVTKVYDTSHKSDTTTVCAVAVLITTTTVVLLY